MGERRGVYRVLVGKPERQRPLGRQAIRMHREELGWEGVWAGFIWLRIGQPGAYCEHGN